jgi:hypothetical protein
MIISSKEKSMFHNEGLLVLKNFYKKDEIISVQRGIYDVIGQVALKFGFLNNRPLFKQDNFDVNFLNYLKQDRQFGGIVYDQVKQIPEFLNLMSTSRHVEVFKQLRENSFPLVAGGGYGIRMDHPNEDKFRAFWHQEYPAQLRSINGIVFWSPLVDMSPEIGPVSFLPKSHLEGPLKVFQDFGSQGQSRVGAYTLRLSKEDALLEKYSSTAPLLEIGDVVCVDYLTVHASGFNRSHRTRWSMQYRYFDMADESGRAFNWQGSYAGGVNFSDIHPDLLEKK